MQVEEIQQAGRFSNGTYTLQGYSTRTTVRGWAPSGLYEKGLQGHKELVSPVTAASGSSPNARRM